MNLYVFAGPTLYSQKGQKELDTTYLPPVSQGDVYRVAVKKPFAIGIIDGYFDRIPAVWHKEILWAMAQGIHVFGAASMGALRAAELNAFGMNGIGKIFRDFRDGKLEDDDEVAVIHREDYMPLSEAMVNMRYTFNKAECLGIISSSTRVTLEHIAKRIFYPERTYPAVLEEAYKSRLFPKELTEFKQWLPTGRVDQKLDDAIAMLRTMRKMARKGRVSQKVNYVFEHTCAWEQLTYEAGELKTENTSSEAVFTASVLEELRLEGNSYSKAANECLLRLLLKEKLHYNGEKIDEVSLLETVVAFREVRGLSSSSDIRKWLEHNSLTEKQFLYHMTEETKLQKAKALLREEIERLLPAYLRLSGQYSHLAQRSVHKRQVLGQLGLENPTSNDVGMNDDGLLEWYFEDRSDRSPISDLCAYARTLGYRDTEDLIEAVRREKCYLMHSDRLLRDSPSTDDSPMRLKGRRK